MALSMSISTLLQEYLGVVLPLVEEISEVDTRLTMALPTAMFASFRIKKRPLLCPLDNCSVPITRLGVCKAVLSPAML